MSTVHHYYSVMRVNDEHTTVLPGDYFNFDVKVRFHSANTFPAGLQHHLSPAAIPAQDFFQHGPTFLHTMFSLSPFSLFGCTEQIIEGVLSDVQGLFRVENLSSFISLEPQESQNRIIPLTITVIILKFEDRAIIEEGRQRYIRSQRVSSRRSERLATRRSERLRASQRQSSRQNQRQSSEVEYDSDDEVMINSFLKKCTVMRGREDCCICLEELSVNPECYTLPCQHAFHLPCILTWLKNSQACPLCRHSLRTAETAEN
ncbi:E3 ubiquitin-protein ligase [Vigna unguiculata]|uniref:E3 ubiquitin-protein ligase n=1 Tax=Vigna unguiculata TaxID=3917 RepID=A0A4D6LDZ1_VIGUN|nr:E3 ubiquitin-protein ligase [Vigna unguiculata]